MANTFENLSDRTELTALVADTYFLHFLDGTVSKKFEMSNWIASPSEVTGGNAFKYITPFAIDGFIPNTLATNSKASSGNFTILTIATNLTLEWETSSDQIVIVNATGDAITLTYKVEYTIGGVNGFVLGTTLSLADSTTGYFSSQILTVNAANALTTAGDTFLIHNLSIKDGTIRYSLMGVLAQLENSFVTTVAAAYNGEEKA